MWQPSLPWAVLCTHATVAGGGECIRGQGLPRGSLTCGDEVVAAGRSTHGLDAAVMAAAVHQAARCRSVPHVQGVVPASRHQPGIILRGTDGSSQQQSAPGNGRSGMSHMCQACSVVMCACASVQVGAVGILAGAVTCQLWCQCSASGRSRPHQAPPWSRPRQRCCSRVPATVQGACRGHCAAQTPGCCWQC